MRKDICLVFVALAAFFFASSYGESPTNKFSGHLLQTLFNEDDRGDNAVMSSVSLYDVLALVQQGAMGNTLKELSDLLNADAESTRNVYSNITKNLKATHYKAELQFANKIYAQEDFSIKPSFQEIAVRDFQSAVQTTDFSDNQKAAEEVNAWVAENTHQRIKELISKDAITADTVMILLNAVFFSGEWANPFQEDGTQDKSFTTLKGTNTQVPTMQLNDILNAADCPAIGAKYVHLPFQGGDFTMVVVVPNEVDGLSSVINKLQQEGLSKLIETPELRYVDLQMPKFKFESKFNLVSPLGKMGLKDIFSEAAANLRGIADAQLYVSDVVQKANIEVDEKGATAAAATGAVINFFSAHILDNNELLEIKADHPFLFFITDKNNFVPLFSGWVGSP